MHAVRAYFLFAILTIIGGVMLLGWANPIAQAAQSPPVWVLRAVGIMLLGMGDLMLACAAGHGLYLSGHDDAGLDDLHPGELQQTVGG